MEDSLIHFISGALFAFFLVTGIHSFLCARHSGSRPHLLFAICLGWMALIEVKEYFLSFMPSFEYEVVGAAFTLPDLFALPLLSLFFFELVMPGRVNFRYAFRMLCPFVLLIVLYCLGLFLEPYKAYSTLPEMLDDLPAIHPTILMFYILYIIGYGVFAVIKIFTYSYRYTEEIEQTYSFTEGINLHWIRWFSVALVLYFVIYMVMICFTPTFAINISIHVMTLCIWVWLYSSVFQYKIPEIIRNYWDDTAEDSEDQDDEQESSEEGRFDALEDRIEAVLHEKKMYLNPALTIVSLASECCTNRTSLSQYFNTVKGQTFRDYINHCRIEHSIKLMSDEKRKITELAELSGFGSTVTFYRAFTKEKGMSPQQWQAKYGAQ